MPDFVPLGSLAAFSEWKSPRPWGPEGAWRITFGDGRGVIDDLVAGLFDHREVARGQRCPWKTEPHGVILGCTPWLTSMRIAEVLTTMRSCIVIDKQPPRNRAVQHLMRSGQGVRQDILGLGDLGPMDKVGRAPREDWFVPWRGDRELEPLRMLGFQSEQGPILHAKLVVCCAACQWETEPGEVMSLLNPLSVWMGSANWTQRASAHVEFGAWSTDKQLCDTALKFLRAVVKASEPVSSSAPGPLPELVPVEYDDSLDEDGEEAAAIEAENDLRALHSQIDQDLADRRTDEGSSHRHEYDEGGFDED